LSRLKDATGLRGQPAGRRESIIGKKNPPAALIAIEAIASRILVIRGQKVMLDSDLAALYGVETRRLNEQVRRNAERFPLDFVFQISSAEWDSLRSQFATLKTGRGQHRKYLPYVFTEHGWTASSRMAGRTTFILAGWTG
jgi:hypothetical protein